MNVVIGKFALACPATEDVSFVADNSEAMMGSVERGSFGR